MLAACAAVLSAPACLPRLAESAATASDNPDPVDEPARPLSVAVVGDSLIASTSAEQQQELGRRGYHAAVHGEPGRPLTDPWVQDRLHAVSGSDIVVVATASNDNVQLARRADAVGLEQAGRELAGSVHDAIQRLRAGCTVWVDVRERTSSWYRPETAGTTNAVLRAVATSDSATVVTWSSISAAHDRHDWFGSDELHFVDDQTIRRAGMEAYAAAIADGVDRCAASLASTS